MKARFAMLVVTATLAAMAPAIFGQDSRPTWSTEEGEAILRSQQRARLKGIALRRIVFVGGENQAESLDLASTIELQLRRYNIICTTKPEKELPGEPLLFAQLKYVDRMGDRQWCRAQLEVREWARLVRDPTNELFVTSWERERLFAPGSITKADLKKELLLLVDVFCSDYATANEKK